jgi:hypothetical protein
VAETGALKEPVDDGNAMVPGFNEKISSGEGGHGEFQFVKIGGVLELVGERRGGIE